MKLSEAWKRRGDQKRYTVDVRYSGKVNCIQDIKNHLMMLDYIRNYDSEQEKVRLNKMLREAN